MNYLDKYKVNVPEGRSGQWYIEKFTVKENDIGNLHYGGRYVPAGTYTRLMKDNSWDNPMMSDTPAEISDHLDFINVATGRCLINGLGLGMVLKAILNKPEVTHVDVVEKDKDIINLVWATYQDHDRVTLYHDDAFTIQWAKGTKWECAWHDIWGNICTDNLSEIAKLKHKYAGKARWQKAWVEDLLRYNRRRGM